jgi:outer membrane protein TolC
VVRAAVIVCVLALSAPARAESTKPALPTDATLSELIRESLSARPELAQAKAVARANEERVSQAGALPDPMLQIGIQNDGFRSIEIGKMETSFVSLMAAQTFPWPGKLRLREQAAKLGARQTQTAILRVLLSTEADVRRAYLDLVLARDRLTLQGELEHIWQRALGVAQVRYASGSGSQTDVLRAQLELTRAQQRKLALEAREQAQIRALNRLRAHRLDQAIDTSQTHVRDLAVLEPFAAVFSSEQALAHSPELAAAKLAENRAQSNLSLAEHGYYPDLTLSAGFMYRGQLPPMWLATIAGPLPIFAGSKQNRAVAENGAWLRAAKSEENALQQLLRLRSEERRLAFQSLRQTIELYQRALLVESAATSESALTQYAVGKLAFASVLEANAGYIADQESFLDTVVAAQRLLIAEAELNLAASPMPVESASSSSMTTGGNQDDAASPSM